jgi:hypothetical protein
LSCNLKEVSNTLAQETFTVSYSTQ